MFYIKSWAVLVTNVPHETVFKATDSNNFYLLLLLSMLFLCILPVAYTLVWLKPSWHCGPFSDYEKIYRVSTTRLLEILPKKLHPILDYITSPGIIIPTLVLLVLTIWYLLSLKAMLRESNEDLKSQLHHERTEGRRKLAAGRKGSVEEKPMTERWKSVLPTTSTETSQRSKAIEGQEGSVYASIQKRIEPMDLGEESGRTKKEQQLLNTRIHAKIQRLERPSMSSINPASLRCLTPSPGMLDLSSNFTDAEILENPDNESKISEDSTDDRNISDLEEDLNIQSLNESDLHEKVQAPKIWISKSASMEHDLD